MCWSYNRQYGTKYLAVMPTNLYGPGDTIIWIIVPSFRH
ncbi:MAG: NAD-dependent epimerase/dehydratase family protein [Methylococcaceae bacterium]